MPKVKFDYNINKDSWSWVLIAKDKNLWGLDWKNEVAHIPEDLLNKILKYNFSKAQNIAEQYIEKNPESEFKNKIIKIQIKALDTAWKNIEKKYFKILEEVTQKTIFSENFTCFFTSGFMCPYDEKGNWFMVSMWHSLPNQVTTICHEIMHLQFLKYYKNYLKKKGLNNKQIEDLKESLSFLLDESEFKKIILVEDSGYPEHKKLREKLRKIWDKDKNFKSFLDKAILEVKKK